jgi:hypothetical protein
MNNVFFDEIDDVPRRYWLHRNNSLFSLGGIIYDGQNKLMAFTRWRINLTDHVHGPSSEWPRFDDRIHYWCWYYLYFPKPLTGLASFIIFEAIFQHVRPIISQASDQPLHLVGWLMSTIRTFMDFM